MLQLQESVFKHVKQFLNIYSELLVIPASLKPFFMYYVTTPQRVQYLIYKHDAKVQGEGS